MWPDHGRHSGSDRLDVVVAAPTPDGIFDLVHGGPIDNPTGRMPARCSQLYDTVPTKHEQPAARRRKGKARSSGPAKAAKKKTKTKKKSARKKAAKKKTARKTAKKKTTKKARQPPKKPARRRRPQKIDYSKIDFIPKPWMRIRAGERLRYIGRVHYWTHVPGTLATVVEDEYGNGLVLVRFDGTKEDELTETRYMKRLRVRKE